jgi:hypothetical protein
MASPTRNSRSARLALTAALLMTSGLVISGGLLATAVAAPDVTEPALVDAQSAPDDATAQAIAQAFGHPVVVDGDTTQSELTTAQPDGSMQLALSSAPARVEEDGGWVDVDTTLVAAADGSIAPIASAADVTLGGAGSRVVARLALDEGSVSYGWPTALPAPRLAGSTATYAEVQPGVDLRVDVTATGVETSLVYKSRQAAAAPDVKVPLTVHGLSASLDDSGAVSYTDSAGDVAASTPAPQAWDSRGGGMPDAPGDGPVEDVPNTVKTAAGAALSTDPSATTTTQATGALTDQLQVPTSLLNDPATVYPLVVDPGLDCTNCGEGHHGYTEMNDPSEIDSSWDGGQVHVGTFDGGATRTRGLYQFAQGSSHGATIVKATLNLTEVDSWNTTPHAVTVYKSGVFNASSQWPDPGVLTSSNAVTASFAYGHEVSHSAGFNVTGIVTDFANDPTASSYNFQLRASETDSAAWKEFAAGATVVVNYDRAPGTPYGRSVSGCSFQCTSPEMIRDSTPSLTGNTTDPDGDDLRYDFEVWAGRSTSPTTRTAYGSVSGVASGHTATWTTNQTLPEGDYEYRVRAYDGLLYGPWSSGWIIFTVDTAIPAPPVLSPSGPVSTVPSSYAGVIGASSETVTISSAASDHAWGYVYTIGPSDSPQPYPASVTCDDSAGAYVTVCPGTVGLSASITIAPVDVVSKLSVWTFDAAGNIHSAAAAVNFYADDDTAPRTGHQWLTGTGAVDANGVPDTAACPQDDIADSASPGLPLHLTGGVCWGIGNGHLGPPPVGLLQFDGTPARAATAGPAIDTTRSFTVAAWVNAADASTTLVRPVLSQDASNISSFFLQNNIGHWSFCVPSSDMPTYAGTCATSVDPVTPGAWTFVVGEWDAVNHQVRLYNSGGGSASAPVVESQHSMPASTGAVFVGRDKVGTAYRFFNGQIYHPTVLQGDLSSTQILDLGHSDQPPAAL